MFLRRLKTQKEMFELESESEFTQEDAYVFTNKDTSTRGYFVQGNWTTLIGHWTLKIPWGTLEGHFSQLFVWKIAQMYVSSNRLCAELLNGLKLKQ